MCVHLWDQDGWGRAEPGSIPCDLDNELGGLLFPVAMLLQTIAQVSASETAKVVPRAGFLLFLGSVPPASPVIPGPERLKQGNMRTKMVGPGIV